VTVEGRDTALLKTSSLILKKEHFASTSGSLYKAGRVGKNAPLDSPFLLVLRRGEVSNQIGATGA
jgi:hypothetical protein